MLLYLCVSSNNYDFSVVVKNRVLKSFLRVYWRILIVFLSHSYQSIQSSQSSGSSGFIGTTANYHSSRSFHSFCIQVWVSIDSGVVVVFNRRNHLLDLTNKESDTRMHCNAISDPAWMQFVDHWLSAKLALFNFLVSWAQRTGGVTGCSNNVACSQAKCLEFWELCIPEKT